MPRPPADGDESSVPNFKFSFVESLLYGFHKLARQCPDFLTHDPQVLKDFRTRLMYLARGVQTYLKALNSHDKDACHPKDAEVIQVSPKLLNNINTLIKDLFYQPPIYKCNVELSFKTKNTYSVKVIVLSFLNLKILTETSFAEVSRSRKRYNLYFCLQRNNDQMSQKRHTPIIFDNTSSNKHVRSNRPGESVKLYAPPSGKFSNSFQNYGKNLKTIQSINNCILYTNNLVFTLQYSNLHFDNFPWSVVFCDFSWQLHWSKWNYSLYLFIHMTCFVKSLSM